MRAGHLLRRGPLLDLGTGNGKNAEYLADQGFRVVGIDFAPRGLYQAVRRPGAVQYVLGDVRELPFVSRSFRSAIDIGCLHALPAEDWPRYTAELARVLEPGALLLLRAFSNLHPGRVQPWGEFRTLPITFSSRRQLLETFDRDFTLVQARTLSWGELAGWPWLHHAHELVLQRRWTFSDLPFRELACFVTTIERLESTEGPFDRMYFGHETCTRRMPRVPEVLRAIAACRSAGRALTLVTPVTAHPEQVLSLVEAYASAQPDGELVVNDLGVLRTTRRLFPDLKPVLGRLLTRHRRDPRLAGCAETAESRRLLSRTMFGNQETSEWLHERGIVRAEVDNPPFELDLEAPPVPVSVYFPFVLVTVRRCDVACEPEVCCEPVFLRHADVPGALILKGAAQFFRNAAFTNFGAAGADRLVWQPEPPG